MSTVTVAEIRDEMRRLTTLVQENQVAEAELVEDLLRIAVLQAIAEGACEDPKACASEVLRSARIWG